LNDTKETSKLYATKESVKAGISEIGLNDVRKHLFAQRASTLALLWSFKNMEKSNVRY
jgi:hypothetical protein